MNRSYKKQFYSFIFLIIFAFPLSIISVAEEIEKTRAPQEDYKLGSVTEYLATFRFPSSSSVVMTRRSSLR